MTCKTISDVQRDHARYSGVVNHDGGFLGGIPAEVVDYVDDHFGREARWETGDGFFFSADDRSVIVALQQPSKIVLCSVSKYADLVGVRVSLMILN